MEFALISVLLVLLLFGVIQLGVYFYARNIVSAAAADAARYASAAGVPSSAGGSRAEDIIVKALGLHASSITCTSGPGTDSSSGLPVTTVHCAGRMRALLTTVTIPLTLDFTSSALTESAR